MANRGLDSNVPSDSERQAGGAAQQKVECEILCDWEMGRARRWNSMSQFVPSGLWTGSWSCSEGRAKLGQDMSTKELDPEGRLWWCQCH